MTGQFLLIQGIGFLGTTIFFASYQCRSNKNLFRVQFISYFCYTVHLLLLGAATGGVSYVLNTLRSFCLGSSKAWLKGRGMCCALCFFQLLALYFTWSGWISLLPVAGNIASTLGGYTHNARKIRLVSMFINSPLWIVYDLAVSSWAGILDEVVTELSILISVRRYGWKDLDRIHE